MAARRSRSARCRPTKPVPPVTATFIVALARRQEPRAYGVHQHLVAEGQAGVGGDAYPGLTGLEVTRSRTECNPIRTVAQMPARNGGRRWGPGSSRSPRRASRGRGPMCSWADVEQEGRVVHLYRPGSGRGPLRDRIDRMRKRRRAASRAVSWSIAGSKTSTASPAVAGEESVQRGRRVVEPGRDVDPPSRRVGRARDPTPNVGLRRCRRPTRRRRSRRWTEPPDECRHERTGAGPGWAGASVPPRRPGPRRPVRPKGAALNPITSNGPAGRPVDGALMAVRAMRSDVRRSSPVARIRRR